MSDFAASILLFAVGTAMALAMGRIARRNRDLYRDLRPFTDLPVKVTVWDGTLPGSDGVEQRIETIRIIGVGMWLFLRSGAGGKRTALKIAQYRDPQIAGRQASIPFVHYVQWAGKRLRSPEGKRAPGTVVITLI
ncbi:MAG TPA: hypothetical protein VMF29_05670 [Candidatus Edwardsbacteria bacterium]|nr:hypothetical protein [Candidatus Edwardsbacteria bacterium]